MKKFLKILLTFIVIIGLICLAKNLGILDFSALNVSEEKIASYSGFYFDKLEQQEKEIYVKIDEAVKSRKKQVIIGIHKNSDLTEKVSKVLTSYFYDNPECYFVSNEYMISTRDLKLFKYSTLKLKYLVTSDSQLALKNTNLKIAVNKILNESVQEGMTDFEKELAIHDALVDHVTYYEYENINDIPAIKHTAYAALVEKEAVCDGYSKAFKMLLEEVGIESQIICGKADNISHAWNIVKIEDEYYHVDVTSDKIVENSNKFVVHTYFNLTDEQITKTHTIDKRFDYPKAKSLKYNYYIQEGYYISLEDDLDSKMKTVIGKQRDSDILEIKVEGKNYIRKIIDSLYTLNFNNWRSIGKTSISYNNIEDIYVFIK